MPSHGNGQCVGVEPGRTDVVARLDLSRLVGFAADRQHPTQTLAVQPEGGVDFPGVGDDLGQLNLRRPWPLRNCSSAGASRLSAKVSSSA